MAENSIEQSIKTVAQAIEDLNKAFDERAEGLRQAGQVDRLQEWMKSSHAVRDSGYLYLTWANHYARSASPQTVNADEDMDSFLDEGDGMIS